MDTGAVRPLPIQISAPAPRAPEAPAPVAKTDLPEAAAVTPTREVQRQDATAPDQSREESRDKVREEATSERQLKRENIRDSVTDTLIFREIDEASGEVIRQLPEESILRLRRALADKEQSAASASETASSVNRTL